jgi:hypothetical protein
MIITVKMDKIGGDPSIWGLPGILLSFDFRIIQVDIAGWDESMVNEEETMESVSEDCDTSSQYAMDFLTLKNAIMDNCRDCIRDCGRDCLDKNVKPLENLRCPLQKVRIHFEMVIDEEGQIEIDGSHSKFYGYELK